MYLISALTQLGGGGLLFRFTCSVALRGGRGAADKSIGVCREHSQCSGHTGFAPAHRCVLSRLHCSGSQMLYMEWALCCVQFSFWVFHKRVDSLGLNFVPSLAGAA